MQSEGLYRIVKDYVPQNALSKKNSGRSWIYGYNEQYDMVVISRNGEIGDIINISGLYIALPKAPKECYSRSNAATMQYWERQDLPKELLKIQSIFHWNEMPAEFKDRWVDYIEDEFNRREDGMWFMNDGQPTYITGSHYMYLQWSSIDVGYADYREANRIFFIFWEACKADMRAFGMIYLKIRRSGFSFMSSSECVNIATLARDSRVGILSKTGADAKKMFTDKVVPINSRLPFFFRPIMDGMDKPKTELAYRVPASKITKKNMSTVGDNDVLGLDTTIDWKNTEENSYDGEKLLFLAHDESAKWTKPNNILNNWRVTKTCLRVGSKIIGKCMMGSTSNALSKGGDNYKKLYEDSNVLNRNANGQTKSGLYSLFIPMEWNMEGFIDRYGMPVLRKPAAPILGVDNQMIKNGAIDYWEAEVDSLKSDADALNEFYRQFPRTESHAFRDESKSSIFNLTKIYHQIDYNDSMIEGQLGTRGGMTKYHMDDAPANQFFLEYIARPQTAEIFFEDVLMACIFYGMPVLAENNKARILYHFKNRGYRAFSLNRPDRVLNKLSKTERELGGIPNSSEEVKQAHASAIESYIEKFIGFDMTSTYRPSDEIGTMPFTRTLEDWAKFDINDRTKHDASISSGLAIMANQKHVYLPDKKESKISVNFAKYANTGNQSQIIR